MNREDVRPFVGLVVIILLLAVTLGTLVAYRTGPRYEYQRVVGTHIDTAEEAKTPDLIKTEILAAIDGMHDLGLKPAMYAKIMTWNKVHYYSMEYQYALMNSVVQRCDELIIWRDANLNPNNTSAETTDVYSKKIDNLKDDLEDGGIDYIAFTTWIKSEHPYYGCYVWFIIPILWMGSSAGFWLKRNQDGYASEGEWAFLLLTWIVGILITTAAFVFL
jgi:hypothetical protein